MKVSASIEGCELVIRIPQPERRAKKLWDDWDVEATRENGRQARRVLNAMIQELLNDGVVISPNIDAGLIYVCEFIHAAEERLPLGSKAKPKRRATKRKPPKVVRPAARRVKASR